MSSQMKVIKMKNRTEDEYEDGQFQSKEPCFSCQSPLNYRLKKDRVTNLLGVYSSCPGCLVEDEEIATWELSEEEREIPFAEIGIIIVGRPYTRVGGRAPCMICGEICLQVPLIAFEDVYQWNFHIDCLEELGILAAFLKRSNDEPKRTGEPEGIGFAGTS